MLHAVKTRYKIIFIPAFPKSGYGYQLFFKAGIHTRFAYPLCKKAGMGYPLLKKINIIISFRSTPTIFNSAGRPSCIYGNHFVPHFLQNT
jgi:hypothetical protein